MRPSRASPLPHLTAFHCWNAVKCGSGLARERGDSVYLVYPALAPPRAIPYHSPPYSPQRPGTS
ncbi:hypothetical protein FPT15_21220 [Pseudomonas sp. RGB]|nr:hypothetical protein FPT15_21220 [Pseudomonas sp. RGB]